MHKWTTFALRTSKGVYDIVATYLLMFIIPFALVALGLHFGSSIVAEWFGFEDALQMWERAGKAIRVSDVTLRLILFVPLHVGLFFLFRRPIAALLPKLEQVFDKVITGWKWLTKYFPGARFMGEVVFTVVVTALLVPFVIQPTLVPEYASIDAWLERTANLIDGTASGELTDSVVGLYRRMYASPVVGPGIPPEQFDKAFQQIDQPSDPIVAPMPTGPQPLMDRWDPYIRKIAAEDAQQFAYIKAFMWVESAGRQYAVSHTGCAGLMQFCSGTAKSKPYRDVFGTGQIYRCKCRTQQCSIPRDTQRDLESGDPAAIDRHRDSFPCEMTDARFNPDKIIGAGSLYIDRLKQSYGGNIYLMYIGYNSGPGVANTVWRKLGRNPNATLAEIDVHLADAMLPHYGAGSKRRANSLVKRHLPKIKKAYEKYYVPSSKAPAI